MSKVFNEKCKLVASDGLECTIRVWYIVGRLSSGVASHDSRNWEEPDKLQLERFNEDEVTTKTKFAFMSFKKIHVMIQV